MIGLIVVSHGLFAKSLIESAEMIIGSQRNFINYACLQPQEGLEDMRDEIIKICLDLKSRTEGILILVDIQGGTPSNSACLIPELHNISIVSGVNLPMLLEVLLGRKGKSLSELTDIAIRSGKEAVRDISSLLKKKIEQEKKTSNTKKEKSLRNGAIQ